MSSHRQSRPFQAPSPASATHQEDPAPNPAPRADSQSKWLLSSPSRSNRLSHGPASNSILSSSTGQRYPGRSFSYIHHASNGASDAVQYSSQGVRETTQELASMALSNSGSFRSDSLPVRFRPTDAMSRLPSEAMVDDDGLDSRTSMDSSQPDPIQEESEPPSPSESTALYRGSALTNLFRPPSSEGEEHQRSPQSDRRRSSSQVPGILVEDTDDGPIGESQSLLPRARLSAPRRYGTTSRHDDGPNGKPGRPSTQRHGLSKIAHETIQTLQNPKSWDVKVILRNIVISPLSMMPAVFLGLLLNILDALSYGMILFPTGAAPFQGTGPDGISMFYVSCIVSQVIYSGGSIFRGGVGSEMIEVVPFFHKMAYMIMNHVGEDNRESVLATTITSYALSSILTGIVFFALGLFRIGNLVSFFPRSILTGCIGGVGVFLILTGIEVGSRLEGSFEFDNATFSHIGQSHALLLWIVPLILAILLLVIRHFIQHPAILPGFFIAVGAIFYIVVGAAHLNLGRMRDSGWIFEKVEADVPFYHFYSYYNFNLVNWDAVAKTIPTMFALSFFGVIHVPINIPALGVAVKEDDVNINRELIAHGASNTLSGLVGSIQNYLVYVNSVFFIENGGNSRAAGLLLAAATVAVWIAGPAMIGYIPVMIVACLIYMLGIELVQEALWDTYGKVHRLEYLMILAITLIMGLYDFVVGIVVGIILACLNYVIQTSRKSAIRASFSGRIAESTVRRNPVQRQFLREVGQQIYVAKLAGYLFFGTIVAVENRIRSLLDDESFSKLPIRYLVLDLRNVTGLDFSAAEAFTRMNRILHRRKVEMILSSVGLNDEIGKSLAMVGLLDVEQGGGEDGCSPPRVFEELNSALEACENEMLLELKRRSDLLANKREGPPSESMSVPQSMVGASSNEILSNSPRRHLIQEAARTTIPDSNTAFNEQNIVTPSKWSGFTQPLLLLLQTFQDISDKDIDFWYRVTPYFERREYQAGDALYSKGDAPDGFYLLESGILRVEYVYEQGSYHESIVPGTTCGELPFFGETDRSATVVADADVVTWCMTRQNWIELQRDPSMADVGRELMRLGFRLTAERLHAVTSYVLVTAN